MSPTERRERRVAIAVGLGVVAATALTVYLVRPRPAATPSVPTTSFAPTSTTTPPTTSTTPAPSSSSTP